MTERAYKKKPISDEELYIICMNFCRDLGFLMFKKNERICRKIQGLDEYYEEREFEFEKMRLNDSFVKLKEAVNSIKVKK